MSREWGRWHDGRSFSHDTFHPHFPSRFHDSWLLAILEILSSKCKFRFVAISSFNIGSHNKTSLWHNLWGIKIVPNQGFIMELVLKEEIVTNPKLHVEYSWVELTKLGTYLAEN